MAINDQQIAPGRGLGAEARALVSLGLPLVGSHLAQMAITTSDALMLGWYDVTALAGVSLAGPVYFCLFIVGSGFAWAVMPMVASAASVDDHRQVRRATRMGLWLSVIFGIVATFPLLFFEELFLSIGQDPEVSRIAGLYMAVAGVGLTPALIVMVMKSYLSALEMTRIILLVTIGAAVLNVLLNYALIFGNFGAPELGVVGAALASIVGHVISMVALCAYALWKTPQYDLFRNFWRPDWEAIGRVFQLGWPIGLTNLAEVGLFAASSVMMGWVGTIALAAHGIALQIASLTFMVHLGVSQALTVRVGRAWGRGEPDRVRVTGLAGLMLSAGAVTLTMILFLTVPEVLVGVFVDPDDPDRPAILIAGAALLAVAALFQTVDALQVLALGMLRGVQDTRVPMLYAAFSYWVVGVPASYVLGLHTPLGGTGVWLGLTIGLALAGILLQGRFWRRQLAVGALPAG
ncbi:MATE family efflux transporter [Alphaproteobacteria bacterium GH1-50]|uniref:Multidrug-efflux transporter n=1 Tax=Kangsaoukella pontilimi TaxID=2691042 RepID=A0A7C9NC36_9RHOB|nr:MATE family efflux transporter [Kangsaoukella pontilimi]MXQ06399.1 MATE family efflux transporter [Kangsaoukella pontilimi]